MCHRKKPVPPAMMVLTGTRVVLRAKDGASLMDGVLRRKQCFLLRLPNSLREQASQLAREEGVSLNYFIGLALTEKISRMQSKSEAAPKSHSFAPPILEKSLNSFHD
jgi:hypothetical protein